MVNWVMVDKLALNCGDTSYLWQFSRDIEMLKTDVGGSGYKDSITGCFLS